MCGGLHNVIACFTMKANLDCDRARGGEAQDSVEVTTHGRITTPEQSA